MKKVDEDNRLREIFGDAQRLAKRGLACLHIQAGPILFRVEPKIARLANKPIAEISKLLEWLSYNVLLTLKAFNIPASDHDRVVFIFVEHMEGRGGCHWRQPGARAGQIALNERDFPDAWEYSLLHEMVHDLCPAESVSLTEGSLLHEVFTESMTVVTALRMEKGNALNTRTLRESVWQPGGYFEREWNESHAEGRDSVIKSRSDGPEAVLRRILEKVRKGTR